MQKLALPKFTLAPEPSWREASGKLAYRFHSDSSSFRRLQRAESLQAAGTASLSLSEI